MFVGHYAVGFLLKKRYKDVSLWLLFVSVQFVDILAFLLVLLGVERVAYNPTPNPFLRTTIEYVPYSHSLVANGILALAVFLLFRRLKNKLWGLALAVGVLSHWFLDVIVHTPDMPVFHNSFKIGLGLWQLPWLAFILELSLLLLAGWYLLKDTRKVKRHIVIIALLVCGFAGMFFAPQAEATPAQASIMSLGLYALFTALAFWGDKERFDLDEDKKP